MIICTVTIRFNDTYGYYRSADGSILASDWLAHLVRARSREVEAGILVSVHPLIVSIFWLRDSAGARPFPCRVFLSTHFR
jgi:hypothetical protein